MNIKRCRTGIAVLILSFLLPFQPFAAEDASEPPPEPVPKSEPGTNAEEMLRTYLQLQAQIHETREAIERTRQEAEEAAATNTAAISNRLHELERAISLQRQHEQDSFQSANRAMLLIAGIFVSVGLLAMLLTAYMHWRAVNRLAEIAAALPAAHAAASLPLAAIGMGEHPLLANGPADPAGARLLGTLELLERRIRELERHESPNGHVIVTSEPAPTDAPGAADGTPDESAKSSGVADPSARVAMLIGKGQSLLNLDKSEEAVACFDEALAVSPDNTDALVKKGAALEKLRRLQEAIDCYDRAISLDASLTIAYLHKGGLFNRLERFNEAMQCYEQALHTQEKHHAA